MAGPTRRAEALALAGILLVGLLVQVHFARAHSLPYGDEGHFLEIANNLIEGRGFVSRLKHHFYPFNDGVEHPDDTRQPGVPLLFAALFGVTGVCYLASKLLLVACNLMSALLVHRIGARVFEPRVGLVAAALVVLYPTQFFFWTGAVQSSEPVFTLLLLGLTGLTLERRRASAAALWAGGLCGLLYLTRANGLWLLPALVLHLRGTGSGRVAWRAPGLALAGFLLVTSPWLVRNAIHFGNPIYTSAQHNYWLDDFSLFHARLDHVPSLARYLATHSADQMLERLASGARLTLAALLSRDVGFVWFLPFFAIGAIGLGRFRRHSFFYLSLALSLAGVVWYAPVFPVRRFLVPFHPLMLLWSVGGVARLAARIGSRERRRGWPLPTRDLAFALVIALLAQPQLGLLRRAWGRDDAASYRSVARLADWIATHTRPDETLMVDAGDQLHQLAHRYDRRTVLVPENGFETLADVARQYHVDYLVVGPRFVRDADAGLPVHWTLSEGVPVERSRPIFLMRHHRTPDGRFLVYRLARSG